MSSSKDIALILKAFIDSNFNQSFESISKNTLEFLEKRNYVSTGNALALLLRSRDIINNQYQYLICYFLLWELGKLEGEPNPFLEIIYNALSQNDPKTNVWKFPVLDPVGKTFLATIITQTNVSKELVKKTPIQVYRDGLVQNEIDLSNLMKLINENSQDLPPQVRAGIPCIIPFEDTTLFKSDLLKTNQKLAEESNLVLESLLLGDNAPIHRYFRPEFYRIPPPLHCTGTIDELVWTNPTFVDHSFWDLTDGKNNSEEYILDLMKSAKTTSLMPNQANQLRNKIKENPEILRKIEFASTEFPGLVEKNPTVAFEVLLIVFETAEVVSYLNELLKMEVSLHSLEVVNQLTTSVEVPTAFIQQYIERCISSCHNSNDRMMHRLVRLVCVFLQSLIRNKIIEVKDIQSPVNNFCLEFNSIKEANSLFRLIKSVNGTTEAE